MIPSFFTVIPPSYFKSYHTPFYSAIVSCRWWGYTLLQYRKSLPRRPSRSAWERWAVCAPSAAASGGCAPTHPPVGGRRTRYVLHNRTTGTKKCGTPHGVPHFLVPVVGLEPTPCRQERILSPSRLPIPSHRRTGVLYTSTTAFARVNLPDCKFRSGGPNGRLRRR